MQAQLQSGFKTCDALTLYRTAGLGQKDLVGMMRRVRGGGRMLQYDHTDCAGEL